MQRIIDLKVGTKFVGLALIEQTEQGWEVTIAANQSARTDVYPTEAECDEFVTNWMIGFESTYNRNMGRA